MAERVINHEMKERFAASAVKRAVLLKHGDDPGIEEFRRELSLRLP
jgi:hypothetical protein